MYSNAANTCCSDDAIKGPLHVLWFRDVDLELAERHGRAPAPLFHEGRLFVEGLDALRAVDAYNGRTIWEFQLKGLLQAYNANGLVGSGNTGSNFCIAGDSIYVRAGRYCYRLDTATGEKLNRFEAPAHTDGKPGTWGYIACERGILFGSVVNEEHVELHSERPEEMDKLFFESKFLFALDAQTGRLKWRYDAQESIRHNAIAIGDGRLFLIDRRLAVGDQLYGLARSRARRGIEEFKRVEHPTGVLVVLDIETGKAVWTSDEDIFGTVLIFSQKYDMLLMCYQPTSAQLVSELGGRMAVFHASQGYRMWDNKSVVYLTRPVLIDRTIFAQTVISNGAKLDDGRVVVYGNGGAWDLLSGKTRSFDFRRTYGCGQLAASKNLLLFRSSTVGYFDFTRTEGVENFGGVRPGCWINAIPVGGLVLIPDASAGCICSYQNRSWIALQGTD